MQLYVLRHAIAEDAAPGQPDSERRLTQKGMLKVRQVLERAREGGVTPQTLLSSPYLRALGTAEIAREVLGGPEEIIKTPALTPASSAHDLWNEIRAWREAEPVMVVGHNPLLENLLCFLTGAPASGLVMKKGALACLEILSAGPQPRGTLVWLLTARIA